MRSLLLVLLASAWTTGVAFAVATEDAPTSAPSPFPVQRGTAPPPTFSQSTQAAPPEGQAAGGIDFGLWRGAESGAYAANFANQINTREQGRDATQVRSDLEANGFACDDGSRLDCRIEISEQQCAYEWYVVVETGRAAPIASFDKSCTGRR